MSDVSTGIMVITVYDVNISFEFAHKFECVSALTILGRNVDSMSGISVAE